MLEKTMTPYQYTYQNPINYTDPTGMSAEWHFDGDGNLVADPGDSAGSLAKYLNTSQKNAELILGNSGYKTYEKNGSRYTQINAGSKVRIFPQLPKLKSQAVKNQASTTSTSSGGSKTTKTMLGVKVSTTTRSVISEREVPNPLFVISSNVTSSDGYAGIFNEDIRTYDNGQVASDFQLNISNLIKSNIELGAGGLSGNVGASLFGLNDLSVGFKLAPNIFDSNINFGLSENINQDNTSSGYNFGIKPLGGLLIMSVLRTGNLAPLSSPSPAYGY